MESRCNGNENKRARALYINSVLTFNYFQLYKKIDLFLKEDITSDSSFNPTH